MLEKINLERKETASSSQFGQVYEKLLNEKNGKISPKLRYEFCELAKIGDLQALAIYLTNQHPNFYDKQIVAMAKEIEGKSQKTPEEWEVVAALHSHEMIEHEFYDFMSDETTKKESTVVDLKTEIKKAFDLSLDLQSDGYYPNASFALLCASRSMYKNYSKTEYANALAHATLGYYARYCKDGDIKDACAYYRLSEDGIAEILFDEKDKASHPSYSRKHFEKQIKKGIKVWVRGVSKNYENNINALAIKRTLNELQDEDSKLKTLGAAISKNQAKTCDGKTK